MARPKKQGLDYFPLDVDFFQDEKILAISGEFSVKGEIVVLRLLCEIYQKGYFVEYSGLLKNKLARLGGLSGGLVDEVVNKLVEYNFFNKAIFRENKILTAKAIQQRFFEATKRRKNSNINKYWLLKDVNVNINPKAKVVNVNINPQSKVKESKVNNTLLSKIKISDVKHLLNADEIRWLKIAKLFHSLFHTKRPNNVALKNAKYQKWLNVVRLMEQQDKRHPQGFRYMYKYLNESKDTFWVDTIQSIQGLRNNWDKMATKVIKHNK